MKIIDGDTLNRVKVKGMGKILPGRIRIGVGMDTCGIGNGADGVYKAFEKALKKRKVKAFLSGVGCFGFCAEEPLVNIHIPGMPVVILHRVKASDADAIARDLATGKVNDKRILCKIEEWDFLTSKVFFGKGFDAVPLWNEVPFFKWQKKIVLRDCGLINSEDIEEYIAVGGYQALYNALKNFAPSAVIEEVKKSRLRGRGGAGFPTGRKWELMSQSRADTKYVVCNADEGDPGAFMNRNEIESDPHMLIEGMAIGGYAMGASSGIIYVRAEYPLAVQRLKKAIQQAREYGLIGKNIFGTDFSFDVQMVEGAGAFVCGEETALIASIEGRTGSPRPRPPFPAQKGLWDKPTNINNVETWCNIPVIMIKGGEWFTGTGTPNSAGTKVFSLVGKVKNTGLAELPLGESLQTLVYNIGGGTGTEKRVKAVQSGGPSGGCIPVELFNTPVDYESLTALGAIMGSGGMVVMDTDNCMVDVARYFTEFTTSESCGKCTPCREGLMQALKILKNVCAGKATELELDELRELGEVIKDTALCGLGQTAPNPILTTLKYFNKEYLEHIVAKQCDAGVCRDLFISPCENSCPLHINIPGFLTLYKENKIVEAFEQIYRDNPFPASSGRICHFHCKMRCRREDIDQPVSSGEMHQFIADAVYKAKKETAVLNKLLKEKLPPTGRKIAVVGAGPAGLTAAFYLVRLGHEVTVFEAGKEAGGILRYGIPQYRLPKEVLAKEIGFIKKFGVKFVFNRKIDSEGLKKLAGGFDSVFLATGAYKNMSLNIPGENLQGVMPGVKFLEDVLTGKKPAVGKEVAVIGAGNVAIDAARTAWRLGAKVTVVYRREKEDMPANKDEIIEAENEGIKFVFLAAPKEILADEQGCVRALKVNTMVPGEYDLSGRRRPVATDQTYEIFCDTVMTAIGERVDSEFLSGFGIKIRKDGTVDAQPFTLKTNVAGVYAGGDLVSGPSTAVEAMSHGKRAAVIIDYAFTGENRFGRLFRKFDYENTVPVEPQGGHKQTDKKLPVAKRRKNFKEVSLGLSQAQSRLECVRCLRCDVRE